MLRKLRSQLFPSSTQLVPADPSSPQMPPLSTRDVALAEESSEFEAELTAALKQMRAERAPRNPRQNILISLSAAEQFASECLEYGPAASHRAKSEHLSLAIQRWSESRNWPIRDPRNFLAALVTLLEFRGGHKMIRADTKTEMLIGCKLNESAIAMLNRQPKPLHIVDAQDRLRRGLAELFG